MFKNKLFFLFLPILFSLLFARAAFAQALEGNEASLQEEQINESIISLSSQTEPIQTLIPLIKEDEERVIAHQSIKDNELTLNELRAIFSLRARKWPDGTPITVFVLRDESELHRQFLLKTLKMLPHQLRRQWDRFIYSGIGQGPTVVESQEEMLLNVKATPGGIGYLEGGVPDGSVHMLSIH